MKAPSPCANIGSFSVFSLLIFQKRENTQIIVPSRRPGVILSENSSSTIRTIFHKGVGGGNGNGILPTPFLVLRKRFFFRNFRRFFSRFFFWETMRPSMFSVFNRRGRLTANLAPEALLLFSREIENVFAKCAISTSVRQKRRERERNIQINSANNLRQNVVRLVQFSPALGGAVFFWLKVFFLGG